MVHREPVLEISERVKFNDLSTYPWYGICTSSLEPSYRSSLQSVVMKDGRDPIYTLLAREIGVSLLQSAPKSCLRLESTYRHKLQSNFNIAPRYCCNVFYSLERFFKIQQFYCCCCCFVCPKPILFTSGTGGSLANRGLLIALCWTNSRLGHPQEMGATDVIYLLLEEQHAIAVFLLRCPPLHPCLHIHSTTIH